MSDATKHAPAQLPPIVVEMAKRVSLKSFNLVRGSFELVEALPAGSGIENLQFSLRGGGNKHTVPKTIICGFGLDVAAQTNGVSTTVARFTCDYAALFEISDEPFFNALTEHDIALFAAYNLSYFAWPYAREYVQSTGSKMGLPPVILPLFRTSEMIPSPEQWKTVEASPS